LTIESSYVQEVEQPAQGAPDTVQFWLSSGGDWRIKTFAIDHDIHIHRLGKSSSGVESTIAFAEANIRKTYGDVLQRLVVLTFEDGAKGVSAIENLRAHNLDGTLEVSNAGFAFYNPDGTLYTTQSKPE